MIKTDKVIYHTRKQEEYDWLMRVLEEAGCKWMGGCLPTMIGGTVSWKSFQSNTSICLKNKEISYSDFDFLKSEPEYDTYEFIEVSDLMENIIKTDKVVYRTRTQEEYDWLMDKLGEAGCRWYFGQRSIDCNDTWETYESETCIPVEDEKITYMSLTYYEECIDEFKNYDYIEVSDIMGQPYKDTKGKPKLSLVPPQILFDIAEVREYGNAKYPADGIDNWRRVDISDYKDALLRHTMKYIQNPKGKDEESGIEHYKHMACNIAFICEMEKKDE